MVATAQHLEDEAVRARTEALYREYGANVGRICRSMLRDRAEAEDAAQQVFLSAHRALLGGVAPRDPLAWLATIARRECWARGARGVGATPQRDGVASVDVEGVALRNAEVAALWLAIADLPCPQREALLLREIRGLSYLQLGEALAVSAPAARSLLARARRKVRVRLRDLHTAAGGVPLVETLARLIATGVNPAAPVARIAALGLVAGGAIIAPDALEHHVRKPVPIAAPAAPRTVKHATSAVRKVRVVSQRRVVAVPPPRATSHHESRRGADRRGVETRGSREGEIIVTQRSTDNRSSGDRGPSNELSGDGGRSGASNVSATQTTAPVSSSSEHGSSGSSDIEVVTQSSGGGPGSDSHGGGGSGDGGSSGRGIDGGGSDGGGGGSGSEGG